MKGYLNCSSSLPSRSHPSLCASNILRCTTATRLSRRPFATTPSPSSLIAMSTPDMLYRTSRTASDNPTDLEIYVETNMHPFFLRYMPVSTSSTSASTLAPSNHAFSPMFQSAVRVSETIDMFDINAHLLDQVIFGVVCPARCDPGIQDVATDGEMVMILLVRHFKRRGGLALPPSPEARDIQAAHKSSVRMDVDAGRTRAPLRYPI
jgi:hypothetical protein